MDADSHASHASSSAPETIADLVTQITGQSPLNCYQCGRCAAGCPQNLPGEMDISPTRVMRLLQLESAFAEEPQRREEYTRRALGSDTCWLCAGCLACTTRCPQGVDIAGTMDVLRQESIKRRMASQSSRAKDIRALHRTFLDTALNHGRIHEMLLVMLYKLRTGHFFQDALLAPGMFLKGKLHVLPEHAPKADRVRAAIQQLKHEDGEDQA